MPTPEGQIVKSIAEYLTIIERSGSSWWFRVRNMSFNAKAGTFIRTGHGPLMKNGIPDIVGCYKGNWIGFEVKAKSAQSSIQKEFQAGAERAGGFYFVVRSIDDCIAALKRVDTEFQKTLQLITHGNQNKGGPGQWDA
jgi:hypothetical protein